MQVQRHNAITARYTRGTRQNKCKNHKMWVYKGVIGAMERAIIFMSTVQNLGKKRVSVSQVKHVSWSLSAVFICFCALIFAVSLCPAVKITSRPFDRKFELTTGKNTLLFIIGNLSVILFITYCIRKRRYRVLFIPLFFKGIENRVPQVCSVYLNLDEMFL